jgi:thiol-disulfide isomerase/thioredoxin
MTMLKALLLSLLLFTSAYGAEAPNLFRISGDVTGLIEEGEAVLATSNDVMGGKIEIASAKISGGKFSLSGKFDEIERANVAIVDAGGVGRGSVNIVLDAAPIRVSYHGKFAGLRAEGDGKYNQMLIASWRQSEEYQKALDEFERTATQRDKLGDGPKKEALNKKYWELYYVMPKIRSKAIDAIAVSDKDPLASSLAIQLGALGSTEKAVARLNELEKILGPQKGLVNRREAIKGSILQRKNSQLREKSRQGLVVSAKSIEGETFELDAVLKKNEYVLLEFWASWCGPCLEEIPHMKKAYKEFNEKGFEIYSFSLDDERKFWVGASEKVIPPWINVSDLKAYESPAAIKYGVNLIPRNYLLDKQGNIIASDLRGEALAAELKELLLN